MAYRFGMGMKQDFGYYLPTRVTDLPILPLSDRLRYLPTTAQAGGADRAVVALDRARALLPAHLTAFYAFVWAYLRLEQPQKVIADLEQPFRLPLSGVVRL